MEKPKTMKVNFIGTPSKYFTAKDAILFLINKIGVQGGTGYAIEFSGEYIQNRTMEERMTICNMSIECGSRFGVISPDETTFKYLKNKKFTPKNYEEAIVSWKKLASPTNAHYDTEVEINLDNKHPYVTWGTNPEQSVQIDELIPSPKEFTDPSKQLATMKALQYTRLAPGQPIAGTKIDYVFIGSCTNGRIEDLREAAKILDGKKINSHVKAFIVPGSEPVYTQCQKEGLDKIFKEAGIKFRMPGCSMCLAMNGDLVPPGARCASTSNRNFIGRQGPGSITHLMSPLMAAIAAITGEITNPKDI